MTTTLKIRRVFFQSIIIILKLLIIVFLFLTAFLFSPFFYLHYIGLFDDGRTNLSTLLLLFIIYFLLYLFFYTN